MPSIQKCLGNVAPQNRIFKLISFNSALLCCISVAFCQVVFYCVVCCDMLCRVKAHANGRNIVGQQHATLLGPTSVQRPFAWNHNNVGTRWYLLRIV